MLKPVPFHLSEHQLEDVIEDIIASGTVRHKLECLAVVHGPLLLIDLMCSQSAIYNTTK
jgi:hypothetical protein